MGRLTRCNPAYVLPVLRKLLMELLTELRYAGPTLWCAALGGTLHLQELYAGRSKTLDISIHEC